MIRAFLTAVAAIALTAGAQEAARCQATQPYSAAVYGTRTTTDSGPEKWTYTIKNTSENADYTVYLVQIEVDEETNVLKVTKPAGWAADIKVPHFITLVCTGDDLRKGQSVTGFDVEFSTCPQYQNWSAMFNNIADPNEFPADGGTVHTAAVPEPTSLAAIIVGLGALARSRRKSRA